MHRRWKSCSLVVVLFAGACSGSAQKPYLMNHDSFLMCERSDGTQYTVDASSGHCASPDDVTSRCLLPDATAIYVRSAAECEGRKGRLLGVARAPKE